MTIAKRAGKAYFSEIFGSDFTTITDREKAERKAQSEHWNVIWEEGPRPCFYCLEPTNWIDLDFEAPCCSMYCNTGMWMEFKKANAKVTGWWLAVHLHNLFIGGEAINGLQET